MKRFLAAITTASALVIASAAPAVALDTFYEGTLKGAKKVAVGQTFTIGGWVDYQQRKGKTRANVTPLTMTITSFGIDDPQGFCVGTPDSPTYCDSVVGGYIPSYTAQISAQNTSKRTLQAPTAAILCADTTGSTAQYFSTVGQMPKRTQATASAVLALPLGIQSPSQCVSPVLVLSSSFSVDAKQLRPEIPMAVYVPLSGIPLQ